jgi:aspartyl-tRNA(Asn)/glutamyl-tRNA(Gln) amidotransferase subunit C
MFQAHGFPAACGLQLAACSSPSFHHNSVVFPVHSSIFVAKAGTMEVNDALLDNIAQLARLQIPDQQREEVKAGLQSMIAFVEKLNDLDTAGVAPLVHMGRETITWREDIVQGSVSSAAALQNAPLQDAQYFKVPKVIKK